MTLTFTVPHYWDHSAVLSVTPEESLLGQYLSGATRGHPHLPCISQRQRRWECDGEARSGNGHSASYQLSDGVMAFRSSYISLPRRPQSLRHSYFPTVPITHKLSCKRIGIMSTEVQGQKFVLITLFDAIQVDEFAIFRQIYCHLQRWY